MAISGTDWNPFLFVKIAAVKGNIGEEMVSFVGFVFLEPMTAAILSSHREIAPFSLAEGEPGQMGQNTLEQQDGTQEQLPGTAMVEVNTGDLIEIATPGGGGWGQTH